MAATAVESYATMVFALTRRTTVTPGEWLLVLGAGGGIGLAAVDVGRSLGARVIAAAASEPKRAAALDAGAEVAVDYEAEDLKARVREITGGGADLVVDPVGDRYAEPALRSLGSFGRYLVIGFAGGTIPDCRPTSCCSRTGPSSASTGERGPAGIRPGTWPSSTRSSPGSPPVVPPADPHGLPAEKAADALALLAERRVTGKLVLTP